ncbi:MAG: ABC transporter permease [Chloroflexi bacterium]|nr:ABC transporter permease [Chloroflexota bacterium]
MRVFFIRRFLFSIITVIGATAIVFTMSRAVADPLLLYAKPGGYGVSPEQTAVLKAKLGLDKPPPIQFVLWLGRVARGDLGETILDEKPVGRILMERVPASFQLGLYAFILATVFGIPLGILSAVKRGSSWDYMGRGVALFGQAIPTFWLAIVFILVFAVSLDWLPAATRGDGWFDFKHALMPTVTLAVGALAGYMRITRSAMLEVLDSEYVKLARAKGVGPQSVIWKHAFRNALIAPLTASSLIFVGFLAGSVLIENIFAWPGLGRAAIQAINNNDFPILQAITLFFVLAYVVMNFVTDVLYAVIDPRIRLG